MAVVHRTIMLWSALVCASHARRVLMGSAGTNSRLYKHAQRLHESTHTISDQSKSLTALALRATSLLLLTVPVASLHPWPVLHAATPQSPLLERRQYSNIGMADTPPLPAAADEKNTESIASMWKVLRTPRSLYEDSGSLSLASAVAGWEPEEIRITISRTAASPGFGIMLEEFGAAEDGSGLTLATGLVEGGNAAAAGVLPGDAIVRVSAVGYDAKTECLNYDGTVEALGGAPPAPEPVIVTVKRLVKVNKVALTVMFPGEEGRPDQQINLWPGMTIRQALIGNGIAMELCSDDLQCLKKCGCVMRKGRSLLVPRQAQEQQMLNNNRVSEPDWRLTCRAVLLPLEEDGEMTIRIRPNTDNIMAPSDPSAWRT